MWCDDDDIIEKMKKKRCFDEVNSAPQWIFFFHPRASQEIFVSKIIKKWNQNRTKSLSRLILHIDYIIV